jgi:biotin synthase-related radical SAM superfamily protein
MYLNSYLIYTGFEKAGYAEVTLHLLHVQKCTSCDKPYTKTNIVPGRLNTNTKLNLSSDRNTTRCCKSDINKFFCFIPVHFFHPHLV